VWEAFNGMTFILSFNKTDQLAQKIIGSTDTQTHSNVTSHPTSATSTSY